MPAPAKRHLKKEISLFGAFALGTAISSGFFLLPGMAFNLAGPAVIIAYLIAGLVIIPPLLCKSDGQTRLCEVAYNETATIEIGFTLKPRAQFDQ